MEVHSRRVDRRWKRLCQLHEAVKRRSCRAYWTEGGCRHSAGVDLWIVCHWLKELAHWLSLLKPSPHCGLFAPVFLRIFNRPSHSHPASPCLGRHTYVDNCFIMELWWAGSQSVSQSVSGFLIQYDIDLRLMYASYTHGYCQRRRSTTSRTSRWIDRSSWISFKYFSAQCSAASRNSSRGTSSADKCFRRAAVFTRATSVIDDMQYLRVSFALSGTIHNVLKTYGTVLAHPL